MSHELRTPLNGVIGMADSLAGQLPATQREMAETMAGCGRDLLTLIADVTDYSDLNAGRLNPDAREFEPRETARSAARTHRRMAWAKGLELRIAIADDVPKQVRGDSIRLEQALRSLLSNSIKYCDSGSVEMRVAQPRPGLLRFEVEDTSPGMSPAAIRAAFDPFTDLESVPGRQFPKSGVALALARSLVRLMGGALSADRVEGRGMRFGFEIEMDTIEPAVTPRSGLMMSSDSLLILLVEDNAVNQRVAQALLKKLGHRVDLAANGQEALQKWAASTYDLVLMDCQMPIMDGYEATAEIRRKEGAARHTPIVAVTAHALNSDRERCLACGMDDYITKPIHINELEAALHRNNRRAFA